MVNELLGIRDAITNFNELTDKEIGLTYSLMSLNLLKADPLNYCRILLMLMCMSEIEDVDMTKTIHLWKESYNEYKIRLEED